MPDWNALVRERLNLAGLSREQESETIAELASHLDDLYQQYRTQGLSESESVIRAIKEVSDWHHLAKTIQRAKRKEGTMNNRTKHLWLPGFVSLMGAVLVLAALIRLGVQPYIYNTRHAAMILYFPWLAALPFCGAAGSYLSRRAGGERLSRLACGLFPAAVFLTAILCIILPAHFLKTDGFTTPPAFAILVCSWIVLPGAALLLGALPFLYPQTQCGADTPFGRLCPPPLTFILIVGKP
jgi:hypothetical protein